MPSPSAPLSDATLLRFTQGEADALLEVYRAHAALMRRRLGKVFRTPFRRQEAIDEFWRLVRAQAAGFRPGQDVLPDWLRAVAMTRWPELKRPQWRRPVGPVQLEAQGDGDWLDAPGPASAPSDSRAEATRSFAATLGVPERLLFQHSLVDDQPLEPAGLGGMSRKRAEAAKVELLQRAAKHGPLKALAEGLLR